MARVIIARGIRFSMVGVLCTIISYVTFIGVMRTGNYVLANAASAISGMIFSFVLNRRFTYGIKSKIDREEQFAIFLIGWAVQFGIATAGYWLLIGRLHLNTSLAFGINLVFTSAFMFSYMESLTFGLQSRPRR